MSRVAYVNGQYVPHAEAGVHIEDRGYQFADGVYEVIALIGGRFLDEEGHHERLERSLRELRIAQPMDRRALSHVLRETVRQNRLTSGIVYIQITRGVARRDHPFPADVPPSLVVTARRIKGPSAAAVEQGIAVITAPDIRWQRRDIKSISLLPNILAKQAAREGKAYEAWLVGEDGVVHEGSSTNAWIVTKEGVLVTHPAGNEILNGITRLGVLAAAKKQGLAIEERPFTVAEAKAAKEAFISSTTSHVLAVVSIDGQPVGNGHPGEATRALLTGYLAGFGLSSGSFL
ncbi:MAG TPA: D-amino-acid transaminase [Magnetospirillaceae bacterium]|nr:D-amino-acid transaminase [Magnetospirillaceae bacterium]